MTFDFGELTALGRRLGAAARNIEEVAEQTNASAAEEMAVQARRLAPRRTGRLADSIRSHGADVVADVEYAGFVEYGMSRTGPQPFLRPAVRKTAPLWEERLADAAGDLIVP